MPGSVSATTSTTLVLYQFNSTFPAIISMTRHQINNIKLRRHFWLVLLATWIGALLTGGAVAWGVWQESSSSFQQARMLTMPASQGALPLPHPPGTLYWSRYSSVFSARTLFSGLGQLDDISRVPMPFAQRIMGRLRNGHTRPDSCRYDRVGHTEFGWPLRCAWVSIGHTPVPQDPTHYETTEVLESQPWTISPAWHGPFNDLLDYRLEFDMFNRPAVYDPVRLAANIAFFSLSILLFSHLILLTRAIIPYRRLAQCRCHKCGYRMHSLPADLPCPECGTPRPKARKSLPPTPAGAG
jgi:hypothetical protein